MGQSSTLHGSYRGNVASKLYSLNIGCITQTTAKIFLMARTDKTSLPNKYNEGNNMYKQPKKAVLN